MSSILKDKFYGLVFGTALGDSTGTYVDLLQKEGVLTKVKSPLEAPVHVRGYWNEMTTLMLIEFHSLMENRPFLNILKEALETGALTSTGILSDLNYQTLMILTPEDFQDHAEIADLASEGLNCDPCNHNSDCLILTGATAMYYHKNYEVGHVKAFRNPLVLCEKCRQVSKLYYSIIDLALHGASKKQILSLDSHALDLSDDVKAILKPSQDMYEVSDNDTVKDMLRLVLITFYKKNSVEEGIRSICNFSRFPNRAGAIYGQLAGAFYGLTDIKESWLECLKERHMLVEVVEECLKL